MVEPWCALCLLCFWPSGMYPMDQSEYLGLRSAIERLTLNDSSVTVQRDSSLALGAGWRWGPNGLVPQISTYALVADLKENVEVVLNRSRLLETCLCYRWVAKCRGSSKMQHFSCQFLHKLGRRDIIEKQCCCSNAKTVFIILCQPRWWK